MSFILPEQLIPLKIADNWLCYTLMNQDGRTKKPSHDPVTGKAANAADIYCSFDKAEAALQRYGLAGLGIHTGKLCNPAYDGIVLVGIDLDGVVLEDGTITADAGMIVQKLKSYTEYSPSGKGLHILCFASQKAVEGLQQSKSTDKLIEFYSAGGYLTVTGKPYGTPREIAKRDAELLQLHAAHFKPRTDNPPVALHGGSDESQAWAEYMQANIDDALWHIDSRNTENWKAVAIALCSAGYDFSVFDSWSRKDGYEMKGGRNELQRMWKWAEKRRDDPAKANHDLYNMAHSAGWNPPREGMPSRIAGYVLSWDGNQEAQEPQIHQAKEIKTTGGNVAPAQRKLSFLTADAIAEMDIPKVSTIIPGYLTEGTFVLGCYSGGGKTWLALQLAKSVATGCSFLGVKPERTGKVLFLEMQLGVAVVKERMQKLDISGDNIAVIHADMKESLPGRDENLTAYLENAWQQMGGNIALVVIDVWRNLKRSAPRGTDMDAVIYDQVGEINSFCNKHHAAVMILHHTRKASKESAFQETKSDGLSGSNALAGAMKGGIWMITGKENEDKTLYVQLKAAAGSADHAVTWSKATCEWSLDGTVFDRERQKYLQDPVRLAVLDMLGNDTEMKPTAQEISDKIAEMSGVSYPAVDVGRRLTLIKNNMAKLDRIEIGNRTGKTVKYYPVKRIKDYALSWKGEQQEIQQ